MELVKEKEGKEEAEEAEHNDDTVSPEQEEETEKRLSSKTPDLVPKSFQDKRSDSLSPVRLYLSLLCFRTFFENLGPIKVKRKGKKGGKKGEEDCSVGPPEDKVKFWLPTTPPSVRPEDIFVGKKFDKPQKQVTFSDQNNIF